MHESTPPSNYLACYRNFFRDFPNFNVVLRVHARARMRKHNVQLVEIHKILMTGSLLRVESDIRTGDDTYRVTGHDADGRRLEVVVCLDEIGTGRVDVITVIDPTSTGGGGQGRELSHSGEGPSDRATGGRGCRG